MSQFRAKLEPNWTACLGNSLPFKFGQLTLTTKILSTFFLFGLCHKKFGLALSLYCPGFNVCFTKRFELEYFEDTCRGT